VVVIGKSAGPRLTVSKANGEVPSDKVALVETACIGRQLWADQQKVMFVCQSSVLIERFRGVQRSHARHRPNLCHQKPSLAWEQQLGNARWLANCEKLTRWTPERMCRPSPTGQDIGGLWDRIPAVQEALDDQVASQVNIQMQINSKAKDKIDADIEAYIYAIFELCKKKQKFDGVELPTRSKGRAPAVALPPKQAAAPKPTAPAQPAPAIIPKAAKPFVPTTFEAPKQPQEPNFCYAVPIEDRAIGNTLFNRMLDTQITVTTRKILATTPEVQKSIKDATTTRKVPTSVNPAKAYINTNMRLVSQVQLCCHEVHCNLLVAKELHLLRAITPKIEGLHEVECILDSRSQIVSISKAVWRTLNQELNPRWKITMQSANGLHNESFGLIENLELKISGMKLHVQAHVIRNLAYDVLLSRPFDILTALHIKNYRNKWQTITITDPNSGKMVSIPTVLRGQPCFKSPPPEDIHQESF
jgi:hypothetical protein